MNLKELARSLGLSQTTVSRALNGYPEVSEKTRQRVLAAAAAAGYTPNLRARALATGRSMMIGHVIPRSDRHELTNPVFGDLLAGAAGTYRDAGYDIVLSAATDDDDAAIYRGMAAKRTVDGVIIHAPRRDDARIRLLTEIGLPFVVVGRSSGADTGYSYVDVNNRRAFRRATEFLADLGHRRIALVNGLEYLDFAHRRRAGYLEGLEARRIAPDPELMFSGEMTEGYGYAAASRLLALRDRPTAFLAASTISAFGIRRAADDAGLRLGRDVSVITHDDDLSYFRNGNDDLIFTALRAPIREMGRRAAAQLIDLIDDPGAVRHTLIESDFIVGRSTGPAPEAAPRPARLREA